MLYILHVIQTCPRSMQSLFQSWQATSHRKDSVHAWRQWPTVPPTLEFGRPARYGLPAGTGQLNLCTLTQQNSLNTLTLIYPGDVTSFCCAFKFRFSFLFKSYMLMIGALINL